MKVVGPTLQNCSVGPELGVRLLAGGLDPDEVVGAAEPAVGEDPDREVSGNGVPVPDVGQVVLADTDIHPGHEGPGDTPTVSGAGRDRRDLEPHLAAGLCQLEGVLAAGLVAEAEEPRRGSEDQHGVLLGRDRHGAVQGAATAVCVDAGARGTDVRLDNGLEAATVLGQVTEPQPDQTGRLAEGPEIDRTARLLPDREAGEEDGASPQTERQRRAVVRLGDRRGPVGQLLELALDGGQPVVDLGRVEPVRDHEPLEPLAQLVDLGLESRGIEGGAARRHVAQPVLEPGNPVLQLEQRGLGVIDADVATVGGLHLAAREGDVGERQHEAGEDKTDHGNLLGT